jgi:peroxiredoxin
VWNCSTARLEALSGVWADIALGVAGKQGRTAKMTRKEPTDWFISWPLLALGLVVLGVAAWASLRPVRSNQGASVPGGTPVPRLESTQAQVTAQPTQTVSTAQARSTAAPAMAPDFTLPALTGELVSLSDYAGKPVLINFWATWCFPCRIEMPTIQRVFDERKGAFVVLGVNMEETHAVIQPFVDELGLTFPILLDSDGLVTWQYEVIGLPTSVFVTSEGVYTRFIGPMDQDFIEEKLDEMDRLDMSNNTSN